MSNFSLRRGQFATHKNSNSLCRILRNKDGIVEAVITEYENVPGTYPYLSRYETEFTPIMQDGALFMEKKA